MNLHVYLGLICVQRFNNVQHTCEFICQIKTGPQLMHVSSLSFLKLGFKILMGSITCVSVACVHFCSYCCNDMHNMNMLLHVVSIGVSISFSLPQVM